MTKKLCSLVLAMTFVCVLSAENEKEFQMMDVFGLEYASDPQISPDGSQIVYERNFMDVMKDRKLSALWILRSDGSGHRPLTSGNSSDSSPSWSPDGKRLVYASSDGASTQIYLRWMDTGQTAKLAQLTQPFSELSWSPDGKWIGFFMLVQEKKEQFVKMPAKPEGAHWADDAKVIDKMIYRSDGAGYLKPGYWHLFVLPSEGGTPRQLSTGLFDHNGRITWTLDSKFILFSANRNADWEYDPQNSEIYELSLQTGNIKALTSRKGPDQSPALSPDGSKIAYIGYEDRFQFYQVTRLFVMNRDGSGSRVLTSKLDRDVFNPVWNQDGKAILFQYDDQGDTRIAEVTLNSEIRTLAQNVGGTSLDRPYSGGSFSVAKNGAFAYTYSQPQRPADVAVTKATLANLNEDLLPYKQLASIEEIWYESSKDGRKIQGWIAKPPGFDPSKKYPLIVEIHGGPVANYGPRFAADIQLYAAAGYVVFYANPRGSDSYGEEFGNLIHHNYPGDDFYDLMSGVDAVLAKGYADPQNLFVTGGSGGGVLTAWLVGRTDRFRAAASAKPVINWYSFVLTADMTNFFYKYWFPGLPWDTT